MLSPGFEGLAAGCYRLRRHEREGDDAGLAAPVHPVVDGAALDQHIAGLEVHLADVELHVDLARHDNRIIDRVCAVVSRRHAWAKADNAKYRAIGYRCADLFARGIGIAIVVDWKTLARPDHAIERARSLRAHVLDGFVDQDLGSALLIMAGDDAADIDAHRFNSLRFQSAARGFFAVSCQSRNRPEPTTTTEPATSASVGTSPQKAKPSAADQTSMK